MIPSVSYPNWGLKSQRPKVAKTFRFRQKLIIFHRNLTFSQHPVIPVMVAGQHQPRNLSTTLSIKESMKAVPAARIGVGIGQVTWKLPGRIGHHWLLGHQRGKRDPAKLWYVQLVWWKIEQEKGSPKTTTLEKLLHLSWSIYLCHSVYPRNSPSNQLCIAVFPA